MTKSIFEYINILLPNHKCIALPGLGAFILNKEENDINDFDNYIITPPSYRITFNSELQHDDGILTSYIQALCDSSYDKVRKEIAGHVKNMKSNLTIYKTIDCGSLGKMDLSNNTITFTQNRNYIFPIHFGLTSIKLQSLSAIEKEQNTKEKTVNIKRRIVAMSACAAAVLLLILPSTSITDNSPSNNSQQAGYLISLTRDSENKSEDDQLEEKPLQTIEDLTVETKEELIAEPKVEATFTAPIEVTLSTTPTRTYYLIIGGESSKSRAERTLNKLKQEGFDTAQILESSQRQRIYIKKFDNKQIATDYLTSFKKEYPKYETAWIHSLRK